MRVRRSLAALLALAALPATALPGLTPLERGEISAAIGADHSAYHARRDGRGFRLDNPHHGIVASASADGISFGPGWRLRLAALGCDGAAAPVGLALWRAERNRLARRIEAGEEWLRNGPEGIQHGVTLLRAPPGCEGAARLALEFELAGARWHGDALHGGEVVYRELFVVDARGRERAARFEPARDGHRFAIVVDVAGASYPLLVDPFAQSAKLIAADQQAGAGLGAAIAASGATLVVGAPTHDLGALADAGAAYVFVRSGAGWVQEAKLAAADPGAGDRFGASVDIDANTVVVGAPNDDLGTNADQGSAYVFVRSAGNWSQQAKLTAAGGAAGDRFGSSVAISADTALVGAPFADPNGRVDAGSALAFVRSGASWSFQSLLVSGNTLAGDLFGSAVALDGNSAIVGAPRSDFNGTDIGLAHQFLRSGASWAEGPLLQSNHSPAGAGDDFGRSVAIDGRVALVGAPGVDINGRDANQQPSLNIDQGLVYAFVRSDLLGDFTFERRLLRTAGRLGERLGAAVALDAGTAILGAPGTRVGGVAGVGASFEFARNALGGWSESSLLLAADGAGGFELGSAVAIAGGVAFAGAPGATPAGGAAYVYTDPFGLAPSNPDDAADPPSNPSGQPDSQNAGAAVATAQRFMLVGAPEFGANAASQGRAFLYEVKGRLSPTGCSVNADSELVATFTNNGGGTADKFGAAVTMAPDGNTIAIGIPGFNQERGRVAVFRAPPTGWSGTVDVASADLVTPSVGVGTKFGAAVGLSAAQTLVVGAPQDGAGASPAAGGMAMVFRPSANLFPDTPAQTLAAPVAQGGAGFGTAVAIDDNRIVVGAPNQDNPLAGGGSATDAGAAFAFRAPSATGTFAAAGSMLAPGGGAVGDKFGAAVAIARDTIVVGAPFMDTAGGQNAGGGVVFEDRGGPAPVSVAMLEPAPGVGQLAGSSVGIAGEYVLLGSPQATTIGDLAGEGTSYLFEEPLPGWSSLSPPPAAPTKGSFGIAKAVLTVAPSASIAPLKRQSQQRFGAAVALSQFGIAVGAPLRDDPFVECAGPPTTILDDGGADAYLFLRVLRDGFEQ